MIDRTSYKILKLLYKHKCLSDKEIMQSVCPNNTFDDFNYFSFLSTNLLIVYAPLYKEKSLVILENRYKITLQGVSYIQKRRKDFLAFLLPYAITTIIAIASIIISILALKLKS